ncbi:hypothetical protein MEN41_15040 [Dolichospermum sp. ST_con]|nr:hypothetical protein [Dolichospermum sp. ST_con]MDD1427522.1 hypothetical protein [Dolichospermum sp. ST_sed9]MDD1434780.1 hypothetical protein [Dolichospermum sp. ST_sed6]MDD1437266.1 hypothetical protein [Dolichospermum sp. ST_sed10]MDD1443283.1 hypothetical protein [Dolichospermum sp. ST_sed3]MDD1448532.1 hypothetical protein [Dolichospermum sp. ST_sed8]MDD1457373.1 hypothetical protein [Dolichospermum sp. ST_sed7]MDD1462629.1 hypothetical protein [Dolichospermum sp. ST_sed2]MDD146962
MSIIKSFPTCANPVLPGYKPLRERVIPSGNSNLSIPLSSSILVPAKAGATGIPNQP